MTLNSKYFDKIRIKKSDEKVMRDRFPNCEWPGCANPGRHKAPAGRDQEGKFHHFCLAHVQEYNKKYNYFEGMKDNEISDWRKQSSTGHRPTWKLGQGPQPTATTKRKPKRVRDSFNLFGGEDAQKHARQAARGPRNAELKALHVLGLDETTTPDKVKAQYKALVKRLHPDANDGSRENEDTLTAVIHAYEYLRSTGFC